MSLLREIYHPAVDVGEHREHRTPVADVGEHRTQVALGRGYAGSSSQARRTDPMADMNGVLRHHRREQVHHEGSQHGFNTILDDEEDAETTNVASNDADMTHIPSQGEVIFLVGKKYVILTLMLCCLFML